MEAIKINRLTTIEEADLLDHKFSEQFIWYKQGEYFRKCLEENIAESRITLIAYYEDQLAGCCHLLFNSDYPFFRDNKIPEINDLNVFHEYRRRKIASTMFDELEAIVTTSSRYIGLGVGLSKDYGNAQRMYTTRGYMMDGNGMTYKNVQVEPGKSVMVDDDLIIYLIKDLKGKL
ncbi:hypothetical protein PAESOLCIP111_00004 [Paenibacillus solanacearum]|uniref:N-acetyltransferase domain-containing protein n=1 Tax=Paenibacillus solanacearum TaxID=2048548 RepID=A0A916JQU3_9BACL|nr:GNAT family N-acetyltransferase [Paenibacillus solanacearum]CAG7594650.1 hypothetical protein PAESOLCIP111_00004 [Paenibacillus solanacearum]